MLSRKNVSHFCTVAKNLLTESPGTSSAKILKGMFDKLDVEFMLSHNMKQNLERMILAVEKGNKNSFNQEYNRVQKKNRPRANDEPFEVKDVVLIKRHRHGWEDCRRKARICERYQNENGVWSYFAITEDESREKLTIEHTRDAVRAS